MFSEIWFQKNLFLLYIETFFAVTYSDVDDSYHYDPCMKSISSLMYPAKFDFKSSQNEILISISIWMYSSYIVGQQTDWTFCEGYLFGVIIPRPTVFSSKWV